MIRGEFQREFGIVRVNDVMPFQPAALPVNPHKVGKVHLGGQSIVRSNPPAQRNSPWFVLAFSLEKTPSQEEKKLKRESPMNLEPAPRLPKWIFFAIDAGLLTAAFIIVFFNSKNPYAPLPFVSAVVCVMLAAIVGLVPFLIDYAADSAEYVQRERVRADAQAQQLQAANESLARAAAQIKAVEEAVHKTAHAAENLPYRMQEKLAEFNTALAQKEENDQESLEEELAELRAANSDQLKAVAEKIQKATAEWSALETAHRKQFAVAEASALKIQNVANEAAAQFETRLTGALAALDAKLTKLQAPVAPAPAPAQPAPADPSPSEPPFVQESKTPPLAESLPLVESVAVIDARSHPEVKLETTEEPKIKKPRPVRKARPEDTLAAMSEPNASPPDQERVSSSFTLSEESPELTPTPTHVETFRAEPAAESAASSDGATRLLATAYIGIGNKLFVRGEGPGLSWGKGVPMQFVSIGKWGWATNDATSPVRCELYKNDETAALTGEVVLDPGKHVEVTALF